MIKILINNKFNKGTTSFNTLKTNKRCGKKKSKKIWIKWKDNTMSISIPCLYGLKHFIVKRTVSLKLIYKFNTIPIILHIKTNLKCITDLNVWAKIIKLFKENIEKNLWLRGHRDLLCRIQKAQTTEEISW